MANKAEWRGWLWNDSEHTPRTTVPDRAGDMDPDGAHRRALASTFGQGDDSLIFFGQGAELAYMAEASEASAEERIKGLLGETAGERGLAAARRRVMRRPLGSGSYQAQAIVFSDRERDAVSALSSEPLSELLQLAASRKGQVPLRACRDSSSSSVLQSLSGLTAAADTDRRRGPGGEAAAALSPAQQLRAAFVQEVLLSTLAQPVTALDCGPLDAPGTL
jgi:hypothetical protein